MYLYHYGLKELPFTLTPNTDFYCELSTFENAQNLLKGAIQCGEGFVKIIGEVGTGKTLLCHKVKNLFSKNYTVLHIANPHLSADEFRTTILSSLDKEEHRMNIGLQHVSQKLEAAIRSHSDISSTLLVLIDEAQALPAETLEAIRLLANIESENKKLVQVVMFGQPELNYRLAQASLRQLKQRITFSYELSPLSVDEVDYYLQQRLTRASMFDMPSFTSSAVKLIHKYSQGIPRVINILAHKALLLGFAENRKLIDKKEVRQAKHEYDEKEYIYSGTNWFRRVLSL